MSLSVSRNLLTVADFCSLIGIPVEHLVQILGESGIAVDETGIWLPAELCLAIMAEKVDSRQPAPFFEQFFVSFDQLWELHKNNNNNKQLTNGNKLTYGTPCQPFEFVVVETDATWNFINPIYKP